MTEQSAGCAGAKRKLDQACRCLRWPLKASEGVAFPNEQRDLLAYDIDQLRRDLVRLEQTWATWRNEPWRAGRQRQCMRRLAQGWHAISAISTPLARSSHSIRRTLVVCCYRCMSTAQCQCMRRPTPCGAPPRIV